MKKSKIILVALIWFFCTFLLAGFAIQAIWGNPGICKYDLGPCIKSYVFSKTLIRASILSSFVSAFFVKTTFQRRLVIWVAPLCLAVAFTLLVVGHFLSLLESENPYAAIGYSALAPESTLRGVGQMITLSSWIASILGGIGVIAAYRRKNKNVIIAIAIRSALFVVFILVGIGILAALWPNGQNSTDIVQNGMYRGFSQSVAFSAILAVAIRQISIKERLIIWAFCTIVDLIYVETVCRIIFEKAQAVVTAGQPITADYRQFLAISTAIAVNGGGLIALFVWQATKRRPSRENPI